MGRGAKWECGNFAALERTRLQMPKCACGMEALLWSDLRGGLTLARFEHHVFVCHNSRPADAPRPSCAADGKSDLHTRLQQLSKEAGLGGKVRINKSGCLDQCEHGPTVVVYPEAVWYGNVRPKMRRRLCRNTWSAAVRWSGCGSPRSA